MHRFQTRGILVYATQTSGTSIYRQNHDDKPFLLNGVTLI